MLYLQRNSSDFSETTRGILRVIDGYLYLGIAEDALSEIEKIDQSEKDLPEVLISRNRVLLHMKRWDEAVALAERGSKQHPDQLEFIVQQAFAFRRIGRGDDAVDLILNAPELIKKTGILHYNLACYEARMGDPVIARLCINAASSFNSEVLKHAKDDPDLRALYDTHP